MSFPSAVSRGGDNEVNNEVTSIGAFKALSGYRKSIRNFLRNPDEAKKDNQLPRVYLEYGCYLLCVF